jgi:hypothetical protein
MFATVEKPNNEKLEQLGVKNWSIWEKKKSIFDWHYDATEVCYILEGRAKVVSKESNETIEFGKGDLVTFPKGLDCTWEIIEDIRKHYTFK